MMEMHKISRKRGAQGKEREQHQDSKGNARNEEEKIIWEAMRRKMKDVQNSIYYATEATIKEEEHRKEMVFQTLKKDQGYDTALSILARIRWGPGITYKEDVYPDLGGINI